VIALVGLRDRISFVGRADGLEDLDRIESPALEVRLAQPNSELRLARWRGKGHIGSSRNGTDDLGDLACLLIENIQVITEDIHDHW
jgi:hypothetical protein